MPTSAARPGSSRDEVIVHKPRVLIFGEGNTVTDRVVYDVFRDDQGRLDMRILEAETGDRRAAAGGDAHPRGLIGGDAGPGSRAGSTCPRDPFPNPHDRPFLSLTGR